MRRILLTAGLILTSANVLAASPRTCFDPDFVRSFEVVSPREVHVDTGRHAYAVMLRRDCPQLSRADHVAFSSDPMAWRHLDARAWRNPSLNHVAIVEPVQRVCGRGEWLVPAGFSLPAPQASCAIDHIIQLR